MPNPLPRATLRRAGLPRARRPRRPGTERAPRVAVVGDLMLDVVIVPARPLELGTDVPGRVSLRQGGSAATTARWLARLGARTTFVCCVGRDPEGRALVRAVSADGVRVRASRVSGERTGRVAVVVGPGGERSFVADRGAADTLTASGLAASTFRVDLLHVPVYSLLGEPLGTAGRHAVDLARQGGAVVSVDLASVGPLLARGRRAAVRLIRGVAPDLLFATSAEAEALLATSSIDGLAELSPVVVVKRGRSGATVLAREPKNRAAERSPAFDVATRPLAPADTTGAGDAFDAGFIVAWLRAPAAARHRPATLRAAVLAAHRAAARQLGAPGKELTL